MNSQESRFKEEIPALPQPLMQSALPFFFLFLRSDLKSAITPNLKPICNKIDLNSDEQTGRSENCLRKEQSADQQKTLAVINPVI
jgi:hypothetical protein